MNIEVRKPKTESRRGRVIGFLQKPILRAIREIRGIRKIPTIRRRFWRFPEFPEITTQLRRVGFITKAAQRGSYRGEFVVIAYLDSCQHRLRRCGSRKVQGRFTIRFFKCFIYRAHKESEIFAAMA